MTEEPYRDRDVPDSEVLELADHPKMFLWVEDVTNLGGGRIFTFECKIQIRRKGETFPLSAWAKGGSLKLAARNFINHMEDGQPFSPRKTWREILAIPVIDYPEHRMGLSTTKEAHG